MKNRYPNYLGKMREIEDGLSEQDREILEEYLKFCSLSAGQDKVNQRKRYLLQFLDLAEKPFNEFDREIIEHIYNLIKSTKREIAGKNEVIKNLKFFIRWKFNDDNLIKGINSLPQRKGYNTSKLNHSTLLTEQEIKSLIQTAKSDLKKVAMISLQIELGLRPHELLNLRWKDIKIEDGIGEIKVFSSKTKETRVPPFKDSIPHIENWREAYHYGEPKPNDLVFPHPFIRNKPLYRNYLSGLYRVLSKKAGLDKNVYPYLARHTRLTKVNTELPGKVAAAYGGHSEKTAAIYTHLSESDIRKVVLDVIYKIKKPDHDKTKVKALIEINEELIEAILHNTKDSRNKKQLRRMLGKVEQLKD